MKLMMVWGSPHFMKPPHDGGIRLDAYYPNSPGVSLTPVASPTEILRCGKGGHLAIKHGLKIREKNPQIPWRGPSH